MLALLSSEGVRAVLAETGEEGSGVYANQRPDATVVNTDLPDLSIGAVFRLHEFGARTIIAMSSSDDEGEAVLALETGPWTSSAVQSGPGRVLRASGRPSGTPRHVHQVLGVIVRRSRSGPDRKKS